MSDERHLNVLAEVSASLGYLTPVAPEAAGMAGCTFIAAVGFRESPAGGTSGTVYLGTCADTAKALAANMAGGDGEDRGRAVSEPVLELANVVAGSLLRAVYGGEREFRLSTPILCATAPAGAEATALRTEEGVLAVALVASP